MAPRGTSWETGRESERVEFMRTNWEQTRSFENSLLWKVKGRFAAISEEYSVMIDAVELSSSLNLRTSLYCRMQLTLLNMHQTFPIHFFIYYQHGFNASKTQLSCAEQYLPHSLRLLLRLCSSHSNILNSYPTVQYPLCVLLKSRISSHFARNLARALEPRRPYTTVNTPTPVKMHKDKSVTLLEATLDTLLSQRRIGMGLLSSQKFSTSTLTNLNFFGW